MASSCCPSAIRRFLLIFAIAFCLSLLFHQHMVALFRLGSVYVFWPWLSSPNAISFNFDNFDTSFERYPKTQWSASWPPASVVGAGLNASKAEEDDLLRLANGSFAVVDKSTEHYVDLVPPILHHILLGMDKDAMPESWTASRQSCLDLHPTSVGFEHFFWDDKKALEFMSANYSWFLPHWLSYRFPIQRADALRYFILLHYGGTFLDLDLQCLRSLGPLRRFPVVNIGAFPVGVSNGFMMAAPRHPFLSQLVHSLAAYDRSWFGMPYLDVIMSTGPMFLSAEHLRFPYHARLNSLRVLAEPMHRLNGRVITPLFQHMGASSWHEGDAKALRKVKEAVAGHVVLILFFSAILIALPICLWRRQRKQQLVLGRSRSRSRIQARRRLFRDSESSPGSTSDEWSEASEEASWSAEDDRPHRRSPSLRGAMRWGSSKRTPTSMRYLPPSRSILRFGWRYVRPLSPGSLRELVDEQLPRYQEVPSDEEMALGTVTPTPNRSRPNRAQSTEAEDFDDDDGSSTVVGVEAGVRSDGKERR